VWAQNINRRHEPRSFHVEQQILSRFFWPTKAFAHHSYRSNRAASVERNRGGLAKLNSVLSGFSA